MNRLYLIISIPFLLMTTVVALAEDVQVETIPVISGELRTTRVTENETLMEVALREGLGFDNVVNSNQQLDPWKPGTGAEVILPGEVITPSGAKPGVMINLGEMRLFHIKKSIQQYTVDVYPLGIGRAGRETPEGEYRVIVKKENPDWRVPAGLRAEDPGLPEIVRPGPDNPLGVFWIGLSAPGYGVHGTNRPYGVGRRISYGCLRMYPDDIEALYNQVATGTKVIISYQPIKAAREGDSLLLEVHPDYLERQSDPFQEALNIISKTGWPGDIEYLKVREVIKAQRGIPEIIGFGHMQ